MTSLSILLLRGVVVVFGRFKTVSNQNSKSNAFVDDKSLLFDRSLFHYPFRFSFRRITSNQFDLWISNHFPDTLTHLSAYSFTLIDYLGHFTSFISTEIGSGSSNFLTTPSHNNGWLTFRRHLWPKIKSSLCMAYESILTLAVLIYFVFRLRF